MNFKRNYRFDLQPSWVRELSFSVYKKPKRFYMSDAYNYGEEVEHGTLIADEHGTFHGADANVGTITRYSFSVYSPKKRYLSVIVALNTKGKFWCNHRLIGIGKVCTPILIVPLKKGENRFDIDVYCPKEPLEMQIRTEDTGSRAELAAGSEDNMELTVNRFCFYVERSCYPEGKDAEFMLMPLDQRLFSYHKRFKLQLQDHDTGRVVYSRRLHFGRVHRIPEKKLVYNPQGFNRLDMVVTCKARDGSIVESRRSVYKGNFEEYLPELLENASAVAKETVWSETRRRAILSIIDRLKAYKNGQYIKFLFAEILKDILSNNKMATEEERYISGNKRVFFHDSLDDIENFYRITLPKNYDSTKDHPLFLICCTKEYGSYGTRLQNAGFDDMIFADVSIRGVTLGAYRRPK